VVGLLTKFSYVHLPVAQDILSNPIVLSVAGILYVIEFFADKNPYVDIEWNSIQTFIRIPAGVLLAIGAINTIDPINAAVTALLDGSLASATHATEAGSRALINTSP